MQNLTPGPRERSLSPAHRAAVTERTLAHRDAGGLKFGESTVLTISAPADSMASKFGPKDLDAALLAIPLPSDDARRQELDRELRAILQDFQSAFGEFRGLMLTIPLSADATGLINTGYGGSEPYYLLLSGSTAYTVNAQGSTVADLLAGPHGVVLTFAPAVNAEYLRVTPALTRLMDLQELSGDQLRAELPELSAQLQRHLKGLCSGLEQLKVEGTSIPFVEIEVPDNLPPKMVTGGDDEPRLVKVRLYPGGDLALERFVIVGSD